MEKEILRSEQKKENTWDLEKIYPSINDYQQDYNTVKSLMNNISSYKNHILDSSKSLLELLELDQKTERIISKMANYAYRKYDEDLSNTNSQELVGNFDKLYAEYSQNGSFIVPEILNSDYSLIEKYINEEDKLKDYELLLKRIFRNKPHVLSDKEENIISSMQLIAGEPEKIAGIIRNSELQFKSIKDENGNEVKLNNENCMIYLRSNDRRVRKDTFEALYSSYSKYKETLAETLQGHVMVLSNSSKLRNFKSSKEASLFSNRVNTKVYDNLIKVVHDRMNVVYDYFKLKKEVLKLDDFCLYDTYVNLEKGINKNYSYEEAKNIVLDVVKVFGKDYQDNIRKAFDNRWIDIYPNKAKRGGAYSSGSYDTVPYILLNFQGKYNDVSTLIHELGHSMHSYYSNKNNSYLYSGYKIFVAEVASTVNEMLLNYYMLEHASSKEEKKAILSEMMDLFKSTIYRQTMFSEFEDFIFSEYEKGNVLTNEILCNKYYELNKEYFGNDVIINEEIKYEWERIPHFYYDFYVYQYATGLSAACYIVNRIRNNEENAVSDYLHFLSTGDSMDPIDELKVAGVDMEDEGVINKAIDMFQDIINQYKSLK
ncbi:MAG: oligoendopeptidase F [Tenericutes bacterium]|nr:oligoendopeptidase F [Mycoplasmatota bacterium]